MRKRLLSLTLLTLAVPCGAQGKKPVPASQAPAVSTAPLTAENVLERLKALDATLVSFKADFSQTLATPAGLRQEQGGKLFYRKPHALRLEFERPRRQTSVTDMKVLWVYQIDDKQVIRADWDDWRKGQSKMTGLLDFGRYGDLLDRHETAVEPYFVEGSTTPAPDKWTLVLKPKDSDLYTLRVVVSAPDAFPYRTELSLEQLSIITELTNVEKNPDLDDALFDFKPPKGIPVIDLSGPPIPQ